MNKIYSDEEIWGTPPASASDTVLSDEDIWGPAPAPGALEATGNALKRGGLRVRGAANTLAAEKLQQMSEDVDRTLPEVITASDDTDPNYKPVNPRAAGSGQKVGGKDYLAEVEGLWRWASARLAGAAGLSSEELNETAEGRLKSALEDRLTSMAIPKSAPAQRYERGLQQGKSWYEQGWEDPASMGAMIGETAVESSPSMVAGIAASALTRNPMVGAGVMGGSSYFQERYGSVLDFLADNGVDLTKPDEAKKVLTNRELMARAEEYGIKRGAIIGTLDAVSGIVAGAQFAKGPIKNFAAGMAAQASLGGGGEALGTGATKGWDKIDWNDVALEALAETATAPIEMIGVGRQYLKDRKNKGTTDITIEDVLADAAAGRPGAREALVARGIPEDQIDDMVRRRGTPQPQADRQDPPLFTDDEVFGTAESAQAPEAPAEAYLMGAGWSLEQIADMNPDEREAALDEALAQGVEPVDVTAAAPQPGTAPMAPRASAGPAMGFPEGPEVGTAPMAPRGTRTSKVNVQAPEDLEAVRPTVNAQPTEGQKAAGNYQKAHVRYQGFDVSIENPRGSIRSGTDPDGNQWQSPELPADYGYIKGTTGKDGDQVDVYVGPNPASDRVFVIDQLDLKTGKFDEHKAVLGAGELGEAVDLYVNSFDDPTLDRIGDVTEMSVDEFRQWVKDGKNTKKPAAKAGIGTVTPNTPEQGQYRPVQASNSIPASSEPGTVADDDFGAMFDEAVGAPQDIATPEIPEIRELEQPQGSDLAAADRALSDYIGNTRKPLNAEAFAKHAGIDPATAGRALQQAQGQGRILVSPRGGYRRKPTYSGPIHFLDWASQWGVKDEGGDLRGLDLPKMGRFGPIIRPNTGLSLDNLRERAIEDGYLEDRGWEGDGQQETTVADVVELFARHMGGPPVYSVFDQAEADAIAATKAAEFQNPELDPEGRHPIEQAYGADVWQRIEEFFAESGTTEDMWSPQEVLDASALVASGMNADDAFHHAAHKAIEDQFINPEDTFPEVMEWMQQRDKGAMEAFDDLPPFPDVEQYDDVSSDELQAESKSVPSPVEEGEGSGVEAETAGDAGEVPGAGESVGEEGSAEPAEDGDVDPAEAARRQRVKEWEDFKANYADKIEREALPDPRRPQAMPWAEIETLEIEPGVFTAGYSYVLPDRGSASQPSLNGQRFASKPEAQAAMAQRIIKAVSEVNGKQAQLMRQWAEKYLEPAPEPATETGADNKPQTVLPGAEQASPDQVKGAKLSDKARKELEVRKKASKIRKGGQKGVDEQAGGLFEEKPEGLFDAPAAAPAEDFGAMFDEAVGPEEAPADEKPVQRPLRALFKSGARMDAWTKKDGKFQTPGSALTWSNLKDWLYAAWDLDGRPPSNKRNQQLAAHFEELAKHPELLREADQHTLEVFEHTITGGVYNKPGRGSRGGTSWETLNQIATDRLAQMKRKADQDSIPEGPNAAAMREPKPPKTAGKAAASAVKNTAMGLEDVAKGLSTLFGGKNKLSSGFTFDEDTYRQALPFFKAGVAHFAQAGRDFRAMVKALVDYLKASGMEGEPLLAMRPYVVRFMEDIRDGKESLDAPGSSEVLEPDSGDADAGDGVGAADVPAPAGGSRPGSRSGGNAGGRAGGRGPRGGRRLPPSDAPVVGEGGNLELPARDPEPLFSDPPDTEPVGSPADGSERLPDDRVPTLDAIKAAAPSPDLEDRKRAQKAAEPIPVKLGDIDNIRQTLPLLHPEQQDDVRKVEERYAKPDGHGMLLTNGTGTGKTFSGLGVVKRFAKQGKTDILIVAPSQGILEDWVKSAKAIGLDVSVLESTQDKGKGIVATTYANLGQNGTLADRKWDLVVTDESHKLSSDANGTATSSLEALRAITLHPDGMYKRGQMAFRKEWARVEALKPGKNPSAGQVRAYEEAYSAWREKYDAALPEWRTQPRGKVLMLSATPFAYHFSLDYAEGYLFEYPKVEPSGRYNAPGPRDQFYIENFGYQMRVGKLTKPDADVRSEVMERQFHEKLKKSGSLSGRALEVEKDYDRKFILVESGIGTKIDDALKFLRSEDDGKFLPLYDIIDKQFDYLTKLRLLEAIKAQAAIPYIKKSIALGRKVVVFHDYNEGGGISPFELNIPEDLEVTVSTPDGKGRKVRPAELYREFHARNPWVKQLKFGDYPAPIVALQRAFPNALIYNGTVSNKDRSEAKTLFNTDNNGYDVIVVQSAAGEAGISLHDITNVHQRVLLNLGLPPRPMTALQQEGRIYRVGQASDALFRYMNTGTDWERWAFSTKMATRSGTTENLAMGDSARTIRQSFIDAYEAADDYEPTPGEGTGGKAIDRANNEALSEYEKARTHYFAQAKNKKRRDQREGIDYFATPEPLGLKMVEWANVKPGEKILEPSAGHGAISRYFPEDTARTLVEPSSELASRASLTSPGARVVMSRFEDLEIVNKYDAIVMNPPFGTGAKTAIEHIEKASKHLKNGGRIVALIPRGGMADKRFEDWYDKVEGVYLVGNILLPSVTFERAGTSVSARVVILEKQTDKDVRPQEQRERDYSSAETINEFFDRIENTDMGQRTEPATKEQDLPVEGEVTVGGIKFNLRSRASTFFADLREFIGPRFSMVRRAAEAQEGSYNKPNRTFTFGSAEARQRFLDTVANPPAEAAAPTPTASIGMPPAAAGAAPGVKTAETTHAKTGKKLFVATLQDRVSGEEYQRINALAKKHGGYYSAFKGRGAIPGFQFPSEDARVQFMAELAGPRPQAPLSSRTSPDRQAAFRAMQEGYRARRDERQKDVEADITAHGAYVAKHESENRSIAVTESLYEPGMLQVTYFTGDEPTGHFNVRPENVGQELLSFGPYKRRDPRQGSLASRAQKPIFYSALLRAVEGMKQTTGTKAQWMGMIRNAPGVKPEEIKWIGLEDYLLERPGGNRPTPVTKQELIDFIKANQVEVQEVVKGEKDKSGDEAKIQKMIDEEYEAELAEEINTLEENSDGPPVYYSAEELKDDDGDTYWAVVDGSEEIEQFDTQEGAEAEAEKLNDQALEQHGIELRRRAEDRVDLSDIERRVRRDWEQWNGPDSDGPKFSQYQLPGGENYRELLLTLPMDEKPQLRSGSVYITNDMDGDDILFAMQDAGLENLDYGRVTPEDGDDVIEFNNIPNAQWQMVKRIVEEHGGQLDEFVTVPPGFRIDEADGPRRYVIIDESEGAEIDRFRTLEEAEAAVQQMANNPENEPPSSQSAAKRARGLYVSSHWEEPNILAHIRFNERTDADGKRVLFIEEIQSDWHQTGRKKGYGVKRGFAVMMKRPSVAGPWLRHEVFENEADAQEMEKFLKGIDFDVKIEPFVMDSNRVPDAPFKGAAWPELAMKRVIRWAAENGFDRIAWTPGEVQAERYDLSRSVNSITWKKEYDGLKYVSVDMKNSGTLGFPVDDNGIVVRTSNHPFAEQFRGKSIDEVVGKEIGEKILNADTGNLTGEGLRIGGRGMIGFYDKILVDTANKLGKKWGTKVARLAFPETVKKTLTGFGPTQPAVTAHSLDIPPAMAAAAIEGQPLFKKKAPAPATRSNPYRYVISQKQSAELVAEIQRIAQRFLGHQIQKVTIVNDQAAWNRVIGDNTDAFYDPNTEIIYLLLQGEKDLRSTLRHEAIHALRQAGVITAREWAVLAKMAQTRWMDQYGIRDRYQKYYGELFDITPAQLEEVLIEEAIADAMGDYWSNPPTEDLVGRIFSRIKAFLEAARNFLRGRGYQTADQVMQRLESGQVAQRRRGSGQDRGFRLNARQPSLRQDALASRDYFIAGQPGSSTTQVATTAGSYRKAAEFIRGTNPSASRVLDYGAGLGLGSDAMRQEGVTVDSYEPFPQRWRGSQPPTFTKSNEIEGGYDGVVSLNVLNVLEPQIRDQVARDIMGKLAPGGMAVIGTRKFKGDVDQAKGAEPAGEPGAVWIRRGESRVYQKGFDGNELVDYLQGIAPAGYTVERGSGIAANTAIVRAPAGRPQGSLASRGRPPEPNRAPDDGGGRGGFTPPPGTTTPEEDAMREFAGNINLNRIDAAEDIKDVIRDAAREADGFIAARRGVVSHEQTRLLAETAGVNINTLLNRRTGEAWNAHEIYAARAMLIKSSDIVKRAAARARRSTSDVDRAYFMRVLTRHAAIQEQIAGMTAEAGRALNQFKMLAGADYLRGVTEMLEGRARRGRSGRESIEELADAIDRLDTPQQVGRMTREVYRPGFFDMIREYYINSLLSGPTTQTVNFLSNLLTALNQIPESFVAEQIGRMRGGGAVERGETMARAFGLLEGSREGLALAWETLLTGEPQTPESQLDQPIQKAIPGLAGEIIRIPSRLMMTADEFYKAVNYRAELNALAVRLANREGHTGQDLAARVAELRDNPTPQMVHKAAQASKYQTFQNKLGPKGQALMRLRESVPILVFVAPFLRTPINILKYAYERTPLAALPLIGMQETRDALSGKKGAAARDMQIARILIGTIALTGMAAFVIAGNATGGGDDEWKKKAAARATGWQPYSIKVGDSYYSYLRFDPFSLHLGIVADMVEFSEKMKKGDHDQLGWMVMSSIVSNITDKTWLRGAVEFTAMLQDPKATMANYVSHLASGFVPNFANQIARVNDPYFRDARSLMDKIKERIPGWRETLPHRVDIFGEKIKSEGNLGPDLFSPVWVSSKKDNPVAQAMIDADYFPGPPRRHMNGHDLTPEQYSVYSEIAGRKAVERLTKIVTAPNWAKRPQEAKERIIKKAYDESREFARNSLKRAYPELRKPGED